MVVHVANGNARDGRAVVAALERDEGTRPFLEIEITAGIHSAVMTVTIQRDILPLAQTSMLTATNNIESHPFSPKTHFEPTTFKMDRTKEINHRALRCCSP